MGLHADLATLARQAADRGLSGTVELHPKGLDGQVTLYFYDGRLYALHGPTADRPTCVPRVARRLVSAGLVDDVTAERLLADAGEDAEVGKAAVRAGLVPVERLAALHQEFLLASLGALSVAGEIKAVVHERVRTSAYCALPAPVEDILATVAARASRTAATWQAVSGDAVFADRALTPGRGISGLRLPEADAIRAVVAADADASVDSVAYAVGLTRAEAVHLVAQLAQGGEVVVGDVVHRVSDVPEALLDPKPVEPAVKTERRQRGWFRHRGAEAAEPGAVALDVIAEPDVDVDVETVNDVVEPVVELVVVADADVVAQDPEPETVVHVDLVDLDDDDPLYLDPRSTGPIPVISGDDLADAIDVRVVDANTLAAVRARLDAVVAEVAELERLLSELEAGR